MLYTSKVAKRDTVRLVVTERLKEIGIKLPRKLSTPIAIRLNDRQPKSQIGLPLQSKYFKKKVRLPQGVAQIPRLLYDAVNCLKEHVDVEGLFRVNGSIVRQKKLITDLDQGHSGIDSHPHDMANVLKRFFRELPEPLLTYRLLPCFEQANINPEAILLICLLLPLEHRHALQWIMLFIKKVANHSDQNRMTKENLATVLTPNFTRSRPQQTLPTKKQLGSYCQVVQVLIEKADEIGLIPYGVNEKVKKIDLEPFSSSAAAGDEKRVATSGGDLETDGGNDDHDGEKKEEVSGDELEEFGAKPKKKKRRSGSLSGLFSGIGHGLSKLTGSRRSSKVRTLPTAMEIHDRIVAEAATSQATENVESKLPSIEIGHVTVRRTPRLVRKSPGKRKAPHDDVGLMSASKRQALLTKTIIPNKIRSKVAYTPSSPHDCQSLFDAKFQMTPSSPAVHSIVSCPVGDMQSRGSPILQRSRKTPRANGSPSKPKKSGSFGKRLRRLSDTVFKKNDEPLLNDRLTSFEIGARLAGEANQVDMSVCEGMPSVQSVKEWII